MGNLQIYGLLLLGVIAGWVLGRFGTRGNKKPVRDLESIFQELCCSRKANSRGRVLLPDKVPVYFLVLMTLSVLITYRLASAAHCSHGERCVRLHVLITCHASDIESGAIVQLWFLQLLETCDDRITWSNCLGGG